MKRFKQFLVEGDSSGSTHMEGVISFCYNTVLENGSFEYFSKKIKSDKFISSFIKNSGKINLGKNPKETLYNFGQIIKRKIGDIGEASAGAGQGYPPTSNFWSTVTGKKTDVSKTDIGIGDLKVSVKNEKAQLMSGMAPESKATLLTAIESSKTTKSKVIKETLSYIDDFVSDIKTIGSDMDTTHLRKLKPTQVKTEINKLAQTKLKRADEVQSLAIDNLLKIFNNNDDLKREFIYEASTGNEKFSGNVMRQGATGTQGTADYFFVFKSDLSNILFEKINRKSGIIKRMTGEVDVNVGIKSASYKRKVNGVTKKIGYNIFQTIRLAVHTKFNESFSSIFDELDTTEKMLNEGTISEGKAGDIISGIVQKVKNAWNSFTDFIVNMFNKAKEWIKENVQNVLDFFSLDIEVEDSLLNKEIRLM